MFTIACHWGLSWASWIQSISQHSSCIRFILISSSNLRLGLLRRLFPIDILDKILYAFLIVPHVWSRAVQGAYTMYINNKQMLPITSFPDDRGREGLWNVGLLFHIDAAGSLRNKQYPSFMKIYIVVYLTKLSLSQLAITLLNDEIRAWSFTPACNWSLFLQWNYKC